MGIVKSLYMGMSSAPSCEATVHRSDACLAVVAFFDRGSPAVSELANASELERRESNHGSFVFFFRCLSSSCTRCADARTVSKLVKASELERCTCDRCSLVLCF